MVNQSAIEVVWYDGWATRNRGQRGDGWGLTQRNPTGVHGVLLHHTASRDFASTLRVVRDLGQPENDVPPPLYQGLVDKKGVYHAVAWGRVNHAGLGDRHVLDAVVKELPPPAPRAMDTDGNARFYGFAGVNLGDGKDPWPQAQLHTLGVLAGLVCKFHGWSERSIIGHREWQPGKPDPRGPQGYLGPTLRQLARGVLR